MSQILYTRMSPRHNWNLMATKAENSGQFIRSWNFYLKGVLHLSWLERYPKAQIGLAQSTFEGGNLDEVDNLKANSPMVEVWNVSDLVTKITIAGAK